VCREGVPKRFGKAFERCLALENTLYESHLFRGHTTIKCKLARQQKRTGGNWM
jgi:hypothetical protein